MSETKEPTKLLVVLVKASKVDGVAISRLTRCNLGRVGDPGEPDGPRPDDRYEVSMNGRDAREYTGGVPLDKLAPRIWKTMLIQQRLNRISGKTESACALVGEWPKAAPSEE